MPNPSCLGLGTQQSPTSALESEGRFRRQQLSVLVLSPVTKYKATMAEQSYGGHNMFTFPGQPLWVLF